MKDNLFNFLVSRAASRPNEFLLITAQKKYTCLEVLVTARKLAFTLQNLYGLEGSRIAVVVHNPLSLFHLIWAGLCGNNTIIFISQTYDVTAIENILAEVEADILFTDIPGLEEIATPCPEFHGYPTTDCN